jgi:DNA-binding PadR family transcriptional regulator
MRSGPAGTPRRPRTHPTPESVMHLARALAAELLVDLHRRRPSSISRIDTSRFDTQAEVAVGRRPAGSGAARPLTPAMFHILLALAGGERHGYGIMGEVEELSGGALRLGPGSLYGSIKRMLADGLIEESDERPDPAADDERRRYYRLTDRGRRAAGAEARRLEALVRAAGSRHLLGQPIPGSQGGAS